MRLHALLQCLAGLLVAGCNPELDLYRRTDLGQPLAKTGILTPTTAPAGLEGAELVKMDYFTWPAPSIAACKTIAFLVNPNGLVVAKLYEETGFSHWLFVQTGAVRTILEVCVPGESFKDIPAEWGPYSLQDGRLATGEANNVLAYLSSINHRMAIFPWADANRDPGQVLAMNFPLLMFVGGRTTWPGMIENHPDHFRGVTQPGFDRTIDFRDGGTARIQNLGDRKVRVEFTFFRIIDPLFIIPMIECSGPGPHPVVTDRTPSAQSSLPEERR